MKYVKLITSALLVAALPFAPAALASDRWQDSRGQNERGHERPENARGHGYGHNQHDYRGHHDRHHYRHHYRHGYYHDAGYYSHGAQIVLPFPAIVLGIKHHNTYVELRQSY